MSRRAKLLTDMVKDPTLQSGCGESAAEDAKPEHEVAYQDLVKLVAKHADKMSSDELLAVAANMLGKLIAMQDQRTMTRARALEIVIQNIEFGNEQVIKQLAEAIGGRG